MVKESGALWLSVENILFLFKLKVTTDDNYKI